MNREREPLCTHRAVECDPSRATIRCLKCGATATLDATRAARPEPAALRDALDRLDEFVAAINREPGTGHRVLRSENPVGLSEREVIEWLELIRGDLRAALSAVSGGVEACNCIAPSGETAPETCPDCPHGRHWPYVCSMPAAPSAGGTTLTHVEQGAANTGGSYHVRAVVDDGCAHELDVKRLAEAFDKTQLIPLSGSHADRAAEAVAAIYARLSSEAEDVTP